MDLKQFSEKQFSLLAAPNTLAANMEKFADLLTASIAARARRLYPNDVAKRAAHYDTEIDRIAHRFWQCR